MPTPEKPEELCRLLVDDIDDCVLGADTELKERGAQEVGMVAKIDDLLQNSVQTQIQTKRQVLSVAQKFLAEYRLTYAPQQLETNVTEAEEALQMLETIQDKLAKASQLVSDALQEDKMRENIMLELKKQAHDLLILTSKMSDPDWERTQKKLEDIKAQLLELYEIMQNNSRRCLQYKGMVDSYDESNLKHFYAHWIEPATGIIERQDAYGFVGEIDFGDLNTMQDLKTGLEMGSKASSGSALKSDQVIRYTHPHEKFAAINIEQDSLGRIRDKTVYPPKDPDDPSVRLNMQMLTAIKGAKLTLLDSQLRGTPDMYITGKASADTLEQTLYVYAAMQVLAEEANISLEDANGKSLVAVNLVRSQADINALPNWEQYLAASASELFFIKNRIKTIIKNSAEGEFKDLIYQLRQKKKLQGDIAKDETLLNERRGPGSFGVSL